MDAAQLMKIAILGTFDLENYGDLLFPLLAKHELSQRLSDVEVLPFSYRQRQSPDWPYEVQSIAEFPARLAELDAVLVGGGHLVRFDQQVAPEYGPPSPEIHHPTGLWLVPPFLAAAAGVPVIWNAIGASPDLEDWGIGLFRSTLEASTIVTARDRASRATLTAVSDRIEVTIVPDSAFGVAQLAQTEPANESFLQWREAQGVHKPYVVIQATPKLVPIMEGLLSELDQLRTQGFMLVEAPIGPVLEDRIRRIAPEWDDVVRLDPWPDPLLFAQIIGHAEASVGVSLHLGITSLCHGVPVHRTRCWPGSKYEILGEFPKVYQFDENGREPRICLRNRVGRTEVSSAVRAQQAQLARHWDRIAVALETSRPPDFQAVGRFFFGLPSDLIDAQIQRDRALSERRQSDLEAETAEVQGEAQPDDKEDSNQEAHLSGLQEESASRFDRLEASLEELSTRVAEVSSMMKEKVKARKELQSGPKKDPEG